MLFQNTTFDNISYAGNLSDESGEVNLGIFTGTEDHIPSFLTSPVPDPEHNYISYDLVEDTQMNLRGDKTSIHFENSYDPWLTSIIAIYKLKKLLEIGLTASIVRGSLFYKLEYSYDHPVYPVIGMENTEYKKYDYMGVGLTTIIKGMVLLSDRLDMTWCLLYSNEGSDRTDNYSPDYLTSDPNDTYKSFITDTVANRFIGGIGCRSRTEQFNLAIQFDQQRFHDKNHFIEPRSISDVDSEREFRHQAARIGIEYKPVPVLAIRGGYAAMLDIDTGADLISSQENLQTNRFSLGMGMKITERTTADITVLIDQVKQNSAAANTIEMSQTTILAGLKQVF
jgi:hypothetical protein